MTNEEFRQNALAFPGTEEAPHFERRAFKVIGKRIFATLYEPGCSANFKLTPEEQSEICKAYKGLAYPVPNKWGQQGATTIELANAPDELVLHALNAAYEHVFKGKKK